jgi:hypothetical protein
MAKKINPAKFNPLNLKLKHVGLAEASGHKHPKVIPEKKYYLALINGLLYFGVFTKQWYGLNFDDGWGCSGHQFDAPGYNSSQWQDLWEIEGLDRRGG